MPKRFLCPPLVSTEPFVIRETHKVATRPHLVSRFNWHTFTHNNILDNRACSMMAIFHLPKETLMPMLIFLFFSDEKPVLSDFEDILNPQIYLRNKWRCLKEGKIIDTFISFKFIGHYWSNFLKTRVDHISFVDRKSLVFVGKTVIAYVIKSVPSFSSVPSEIFMYFYILDNDILYIKSTSTIYFLYIYV